MLLQFLGFFFNEDKGVGAPNQRQRRGRNWQLTGGTGLISAFGALKFAITGSAGGQRIFEKVVDPASNYILLRFPLNTDFIFNLVL